MKELTYRNLIRLPDGTVAELGSLSDKDKEDIGRQLNETAMQAAGYVAER